MKRILWAICACVVLTAGAAHAEGPQGEECAVYEAVFASGKLNGIPHGYVTVEAETTAEQAGSWEGIDPAMVADFNASNDRPYTLEPGFKAEAGREPKIRIRRQEARSEGVFDSGRTWVSRVGFNKDKTEAMVYVQHVATPESGIAHFVFLRKVDGEWMIDGSIVDKIF